MPPFRPILAALAALTLSAAAPRAEEAPRSATFVALAAMAPAESLLPAEGGPVPVIEFGDRDAATLALARPASGLGPFRRLIVVPGEPSATLAGIEGKWPALVGFDLGDARAWLNVSMLPDRLWLIRLDPGRTTGIAATLTARGYASETTAAGPILLRGAEDFAISLTDRNPDDPFGGPLGKASRVAVRGEVVVQSPSRLTLGAVLGEAPKGHADLPALAAALDDPAFGAARLVQAVLLPVGMSLAAEPPPPEAALPPWSSLLLADLSDGTTDHAAAILVFASRAEAEVAAARLAASWAGLAVTDDGKTLAELVGAAPQFRLGGEAPATLTADLAALADPGERAENAGWLRLIRLLNQSRLAPLSPG